MEHDTRQYLAENRVVFADVAAALVENRGFARVEAAPSTPWDAPGAEDAFWDDARGTGLKKTAAAPTLKRRRFAPRRADSYDTGNGVPSPAKGAPNDS